MYTAEQSALAESMTAIKAAWNCDEHGTCFIDGKCDHIEVNRFRLKAWASAVVSGFICYWYQLQYLYYSKLIDVLRLTHHLQNFSRSGLVSRLTCLLPNLMVVRVPMLCQQLPIPLLRQQITQVYYCRHCPLPSTCSHLPSCQLLPLH